MEYDPHRPLVVQSDRTLFVEAKHPQFAQLRDQLHAFAELIKSPEYIHTYRLTPLSLWNAAASGWTYSQVLSLLKEYAKFPLSYDVEQSIIQDFNKFGRFSLQMISSNSLYLLSAEKEDLEYMIRYPSLSSFFVRGTIEAIEQDGQVMWGVPVHPGRRGDLKQKSIRLGYPIQDEAGYIQGDPLALTLATTLAHGVPFQLRQYQQEAVDAFYKEGSALGGHGILVLPCGAGKTVIGMASMEKYQCATLILSPNQTAVKQWKAEILEKTNVSADQIGEYTGELKQIRPITIATYQVLTFRGSTQDEFVHMDVFNKKNWGLIIYDEVHLLPAPVFRATASIQSTRRLGLTATLIREDGKEEDVFSLIGPKRYDAPWKQLEDQGFIAKAYCTEIRIDFDSVLKEQYYMLPERNKMRLAQENPKKFAVVQDLLHKHEGAQILIIGQYVAQLEEIAALLRIPVITGKMKQEERQRLYHQFKQGQLSVLAVSKVANFAIDLPDASVAIQISGTYGSRQEEAQRLGRILRPKADDNEAYFYHIVTKDSKDQEFAAKRQLFLVEQGYHYERIDH